MEELDKILRKEEIHSPIQGDAQFLFKARQFEEVDGPPEPPGNKPRKIDAENSGYTCATTDRCQQTQCLEPERNKVLPANARDNVVCKHLTFA
jgi:hypothetical protein